MLLSAQSHAPGFQAALSELYKIYWYPLYAHARRLGRAPEETQEQIQVFLGTCLSIRRRDAPTAEGQEPILAYSNSMWRWWPEEIDRTVSHLVNRPESHELGEALEPS